jgi:uncharacterized protein
MINHIHTAFSSLLLMLTLNATASGNQRDSTKIPRKFSPDYSASPDAPYTAEEIRITTAAGHILAGTLTIPKNRPGPVPAVVTITGSSPQDRDHNTTDGNGDYRVFRQLADTLGRRGIAVLRMDDRGVGQSTGDFWSATTVERANDIREGLASLRKRNEIDSNRVALVGLSEGGMIAPMIAATDSSLAGIVLMAAPAACGADILRYQARYRVEQDPEVTPEQRVSVVTVQLKDILEEPGIQTWLHFFLSYDPLKTARQVRSVPVLLLQGKTDRNVSYTDSEKLAKAFRNAGNQDVVVHLFEGTNHLFLHDMDGNPNNYSHLSSFVVSPEILGCIVDWLLKQTSVKSADR